MDKWSCYIIENKWFNQNISWYKSIWEKLGDSAPSYMEGATVTHNGNYIGVDKDGKEYEGKWQPDPTYWKPNHEKFIHRTIPFSPPKYAW